VIKYATLIEAAGAQAGAADTEEARPEVEAVIAAVAASLAESDRDRLAAVLPGSLRGAAEIRGPGLHPDSGAALVSAVSAGSGCPGERVRFYTRAILSTLAGSEPESGPRPRHLLLRGRAGQTDSAGPACVRAAGVRRSRRRVSRPGEGWWSPVAGSGLPVGGRASG
jgi:hypothetical protein